MSKNETNNGKKGGLLKGKPHYDKNGKSLGGIKAIVTDTNTPVELEGGEVIINKHASKKYWRELSKINQSAGNGVPIKNPNGDFDEDPEEYKDGGNVIQFNANHTPSKIILNYAKKIKSDYPKVWDKGGNIFGNEAFKNLERVSERGYWLDSEKWMYVKWRSYVARHKQDFRINGVVAMLKWVDKVDKGWSYMKDLIESEIEKKYPKKATKMAKGGGINSIVEAKVKTYIIDDYYLDTAKRFLTKWQIDKWEQDGRSKEQINKSIESAKKEIKNVEEKTPYTIWYLELPKSKYDFKIGNSTYKIVKEMQKIADSGWKRKNWEKAVYQVVKSNDVFSPFDEYILNFLKNIEKKQDIVERLNFYLQNTIQENIDKKFLPKNETNMAKGGIAGDVYSIKNVEQFKQIMTTFNELSEQFGVENYFLDPNDNCVVFLVPKSAPKINIIKLRIYVDALISRGFNIFDTKQNIVIKNDNSEGGNYLYFKLNLSESIEYAKGGNVVTYKNKFNKKYGFDVDESHSLKDISKITGLKLSSLQDIYDKGIGAYKTNPESVRPNVQSKEQWAMSRVYSSIMGGKAAKVDATELKEAKMEQGGALYLAPNGRPSNLTPEQYKLVRTPEFKAWFGDWENDPENASKIVDNNGEPLICFHGTNNEFNVFDDKSIGSSNDSGYYGKGFYFTFNTEQKWMLLARAEAGYYGSIIKDFFIKSLNPFDISELSQYKGVSIRYMGTESIVFLYNLAERFPKLADTIKISKRKYNKLIQEYETEKVSIKILPKLIKKYQKLLKTFKTTNNYGKTVIGGYVKSEIVEYDYTANGGAKGSYESTDDLEGRWEIDIQEDGRQTPSNSEIEIGLIVNAIEKYDGITYDYSPEGYMTRNHQITDLIKENHDSIIQSKYGDEIVVFNPNQIKLADGTNTKFDSNNNDIRFENGGELKKGIKEELEHIETAKKLYNKEITPKESAEEIAKDHLKDNPHYYSELSKLGKKMEKGGVLDDGNLPFVEQVKPIFWQMNLKQFCDYAKSTNLDTRLEGTNAKLQCEDFYKYVVIKPLLSDSAERNVFLLAIESNRMPYEAVQENIKSVNLWDENNRKIIKIIDYINSYNVTSEIWRIPMELYLQKEYFQKNFTKANAIKWYEKHIYHYVFLDDVALKDMIKKGMVKYSDVIERLREAVGLANLTEQDKKQLMKYNETQSINTLRGKLNGLLDIIQSNEIDTSQFKQVNQVDNIEVDENMPFNWSKERLDKEIARLDPNESQGYAVTQKRSLKESMIDFPEKARLSFEIKDFFLRMYGNDFKKDFDKAPLSSLSQFFYSDVNSLKEWVDEQIKGINQDIESKEKYIQTLSNSKSDQKSKEMWSGMIENSKKEIEKLRSEFEKYEQQKNGNTNIKLDNNTKGSKESPLTESEISFVELIKPDIEKGLTMNKTKIENIAKTFGILEQNRAKELTELSISILARSIAHNPSMTTEQKYDRLVELYESQPNLSHRTSESIMMQQYSTPAPIGYLMGIYCGIDKKGTKYFEPSAGNGLLVSAGYLEDGTLNELDELRNKDLKYLGFKNVTQKDGTIPFTEYEKDFDAVLTNPPFGSVNSVYYGKYEITSKEQLMALRGLDTIKDDGKAAIIIGGHMEYDNQGRLKAGKNRTFFVYLYENYNIEDVININGRELYSRQGTSFNTRLILINGRKKEPKGFFPLITENKTSIDKYSKMPVDNYDDLWTRIIQHI